jgi:hypothetical protein
MTDYGSDPFSLEKKDERIIENLPIGKQMDPGQRARLQGFLDEDGELPKDIDNDIYNTMMNKKLLENQKTNFRNLGKGDYLTKQPAFLETKKYGKAYSRMGELQKEMRESNKSYTAPENIERGKELGMINRSLPLRLLRRPEKVNPRKDFRGLSSGIKWKRSEQEIKDIKDLLQKSNYDMVSDYAHRINKKIERSILEENPELIEDDLERKEYERRIKPLIIDKIEEEIESELLDDSDVDKHYDEKLYIRSVVDALQSLNRLTTQDLLEKTKIIYQKYYEQVKEYQDVINIYNEIELDDAESEGELREKCISIIESILRITYIDPIPSKKDFDFNLIFEKPGPLVFNTALYNDRDELERDPYGGIVKDYENTFLVDPYDYEKSQYKKPQDYMTFERVGKRYGESLFRPRPSFVPSDVGVEYEKPNRFTRFGGGEKKKTAKKKRSGKKRTGKKKRTAKKK